jgi:protein TonB
MKNASFWIALALSGSVHTGAYGFVVILWLFSEPSSSPPIALVAYGNSSLEGFPVDAVALDPGTLERGDANTPGGDQMPQPKASEPTPTETAAPERESEAVALPKVPEAEPVVPAPAEKVGEPPMAKPPSPEPRLMKTEPEAATAAKAPGASGGSRLPLGTPSKGGTVGSSSGVRMIGLPKPAYPREAVAAGLQGEVMLYLRIGADGNVSEVRVHKSSGHRLLDEAALSFGKTLKFVAARENGQPVDTTALFPVTYELTARR